MGLLNEEPAVPNEAFFSIFNPLGDSVKDVEFSLIKWDGVTYFRDAGFITFESWISFY